MMATFGLSLEIESNLQIKTTTGEYQNQIAM